MNWLTDCIIRMKNASAAGKTRVEVRGTKVCLRVLQVLKDEGFIVDFFMKREANFLLKQACDVELAYYKSVPLIKSLRFISTPKNRIYKKCDKLKNYMHSFKLALVSTDKGIMSAKQAIESHLGGEVLLWMEN